MSTKRQRSTAMRMPTQVADAVADAVCTPCTDHLCVRCSAPYYLEPGDEPTALCHPCAQEVVGILAGYLWRRVRRERKKR